MLNFAEQNYAAHDPKLLGIVDTIKAWRSYLHGGRFAINTDHHPLRHLETQKYLSPRQVRWLECLAQFDFEIIPIKGKTNVVADGISRQKLRSEEDQDYSKNILNKVMRKTTILNAMSSLNIGQGLINELSKGYLAHKEFKDAFKNPVEKYQLKHGILYLNAIYLYSFR